MTNLIEIILEGRGSGSNWYAYFRERPTDKDVDKAVAEAWGGVEDNGDNAYKNPSPLSRYANVHRYYLGTFV